MSLKFSPFCLLLFIFCIQFASSERFDDCGKRKFTMPWLVGGTEAVLGQFPWHAALMLKGNTSHRYICGASIITPKHLLSAAHCIQLGQASRIKEPGSFKVLVGGLNLTAFKQGTWTGLDVKNITLHPEWALKEKNFDADLAILELESRLTFTQNIRRVCLPEPGQEVVNRQGTVVGYGLTGIGTSYSKIPKYIELTTKETFECVLENDFFGKSVSRRMFCAGEPGTTACQGDSGSSFVEVNELERFTVIGVVSSNIVSVNITCNPNMPSAYTSIPAFVEWIRDVVKSELPDSVTHLDAIPSRCTEPLARGSCVEQQVKYFYDTNTRDCMRFFYGGCGGNENHFDSMEDCQKQCQPLQKYRRCKELERECNTIICKYGITRSTDPMTECEKCNCFDPCYGHSCPEGQRCIPVQNRDDNDEEEFVQECREVSKPGVCPTNLPRNLRKLSTCSDDADCFGNRKCCQYESHKTCRMPVYPLEIEELSLEDLNPSGKEDGSVTLRCRTTGNTKPTITWTRNGAKVEPESGRYVLPPTGDLQILDLKMADAGTYVCTANNGVGGEASKEFSLAVRQVVKGEKHYNWLGSLFGGRTFYSFKPFWNTTIDTETFEIASDRDDNVTEIKANDRSTIAYLPVNVAEIFPNLLRYQVWQCSVTVVSKENFKNMNKLELVSLDENIIYWIDEDVFEDLHALKELYLNENRLTWLHEDTFSNNRQLQVLDLRGNQLASLPPKLLQNLSELKGINLGLNKLRTLHASFFTGNSKLEDIHLDYNQIEHLSASTFAGVARITFVNLNKNICIDKEYGEFEGTTHEGLSMLPSDLARQCSQTPA